MSKKQSKPCRFGADCWNTVCAFKHPMRDYDDEDIMPHPMLLEEKKAQDDEISEFISGCMHQINLNELTAEIEYVAWDPARPYVITTLLELGEFSTWDNAYDTLLNYVYRESANSFDIESLENLQFDPQDYEQCLQIEC